MAAETITASDGMDVAKTPEEREFLALVRQCTAQDLQRVRRLLWAARNGLLPDAAKVAGMTREQALALTDSLPGAPN